jgi:hypothetical protein
VEASFKMTAIQMHRVAEAMFNQIKRTGEHPHYLIVSRDFFAIINAEYQNAFGFLPENEHALSKVLGLEIVKADSDYDFSFGFTPKASPEKSKPIEVMLTKEKFAKVWDRIAGGTGYFGNISETSPNFKRFCKELGLG